MSLADLIEKYIKQQIHRSENQAIALSRAELAELFSCVPSQINYVLATRFTLERGYLIESRRGGGGYIRIARVTKADRLSMAERLVLEIGGQISESEADQFLASFHELGVLTRQQVRVIRAILQRETAQIAQGKATLRASLLRSLVMLVMQCAKENEV
ncbi:MAG: CtsR family transcriptional regulator [Limnochordia bacterium]|jgi:transcriptional regulator CtsR|nr:CtsR family transcriptional regulator [Bacillota bacterium]HOB09417.1 CtsR family transcriptional regulator [Limnochordia bacterium]NLH31498.1 CtsR family transcriptional regulator [Bacillota bacterium]HPT93536.1 CtsR family transcriptional regulator [Limnochordia bacterium]HPZ31370.1 CtsR family transcriptional regulator [Limnochordia bacterium]